jgi:hypothetical protein
MENYLNDTGSGDSFYVVFSVAKADLIFQVKIGWN